MKAKEVTVWTAIVTPFSEDTKTINYDSLTSLLKLQEEAGNGVLLLGSTGEGLSINEEEKKFIVKFASELGLKVPLMAGVGGINFDQSLAWIDYCKHYNIDAFLLTTPSYTKPGIQGQHEWFRKLMDQADTPCMLYNIPSRAGVPLFPETVELLENHPNLWSIKESSGSLDSYYNYRKVAPQIELYCGEDYLLPFTAPFKVKGLVSVASNIWPSVIANEAQNLTQTGAIKMDVLDWWSCCQSLYIASNPIPTKALLHYLGKIPTPAVRIPLSLSDMPGLDKLIQANQILLSTSILKP